LPIFRIKSGYIKLIIRNTKEKYIKMKQKSYLKINRDKNNHICYLKLCNYCETEFWVKKINGEYCSNACRSLRRLKIKQGLILNQGLKFQAD
jgi:hypothetical protein